LSEMPIIFTSKNETKTGKLENETILIVENKK
jgi:hypothetical protein